MAYYDNFTKKPQSKRDDWRDDEMTRRPARDEGRAVETERRYGENKEHRERSGVAAVLSEERIAEIRDERRNNQVEIREAVID